MHTHIPQVWFTKSRGFIYLLVANTAIGESRFSGHHTMGSQEGKDTADTLLPANKGRRPALSRRLHPLGDSITERI